MIFPLIEISISGEALKKASEVVPEHLIAI